MRVIVNGALGRMGKEVVRLLNEGYMGATLADMADFSATDGDVCKKNISDVTLPADVIIDFSSHLATQQLCDYAVQRGLPLMIGTTGQTAEEMQIINQASSKIPLFISGNMSVGIALLRDLVKQAVAVFPDADVEIIEVHHNKKQDAPSGTALMIASAVEQVKQNAKRVFGRQGFQPRQQDEIGIHAVRVGSVIGEHEVIIGTDTQVIKLKHEAKSRSLFAEGGIMAASFIATAKAGLYAMQDVIGASK